MTIDIPTAQHEGLRKTESQKKFDKKGKSLTNQSLKKIEMMSGNKVLYAGINLKVELGGCVILSNDSHYSQRRRGTLMQILKTIEQISTKSQSTHLSEQHFPMYHTTYVCMYVAEQCGSNVY